MDFGTPGEVPGVGAIVDGDLVALVEDDVSGLRGDGGVAAGQRGAQRAHFFKAAVVLHLHGDGALGEKLAECLDGGIVLQGGQIIVF